MKKSGNTKNRIKKKIGSISALRIIGKILFFIPVFISLTLVTAIEDYSFPVKEKTADVNGDGTVSNTDVAYILSYASMLSPDVSREFLRRADLNSDGVITARDAVLAEKHVSHSVIIKDYESPVQAADAPLAGGSSESTDTKELFPVVSANNSVYSVISNDKMYIYPDMSQVMPIRNAFTVVSFGWGHGVGMSQWGAVRLAEAGYSYAQILQHYFIGVSIMREQYPQTVLCDGQQVNTIEMVARIVQMEISGCVKQNDPLGMSALRAQAVAAYSCIKSNGYKVSGCAYTSSYSRCRDDVKQAVSEVAGQYIAYNGEAVYAYYSACSAGVTANYEQIWGATNRDMSYLGHSSSYSDCYISGYVSTRVYSVNEMRNYIMSYDPSINLSQNPAQWIEIITHDDAVNENIGYVSAMRVGDRTISQAAGVIFRNDVMNYNIKSPCFAIIYNGQYL